MLPRAMQLCALEAEAGVMPSWMRVQLELHVLDASEHATCAPKAAVVTYCEQAATAALDAYG